jgi:hypothetical protein
VKTLLFAAGLVAACTLNAADFRNATWGMSPEQVIKSEKIKLIKESYDTELYLKGKSNLLNHSCNVCYMFKYDKFFKAYYVISFPIGTNLSKPQKVFHQLKKILTNKYGSSSAKPSLQLCHYSPQKGDLTIADLKNGVAKLTCKWKKSGTDIELKLWKINSKYQNGQWLKVYILAIYYKIQNKEQTLSKWKQEDAKKAVSQTETQL